MSNEKYDVFYLTVPVPLKREELEYFERYRSLAADRGLEMNMTKFLEMCLSVGCLSFMKANAEFYTGGNVSNDSMPIL